MNDAEELERTLAALQREHRLLRERLARRDAAARAPLEEQKKRVEVLEVEHGELFKRLEFHQREVERAKLPPPKALGVETLARLAALGFVLGAATHGLSFYSGTLWGLSAVGCILALMWGYFRG